MYGTSLWYEPVVRVILVCVVNLDQARALPGWIWVQEHRQWREGAEGEGEWAQVTGRRRRLTVEEKAAAAAAWNEAAVS